MHAFLSCCGLDQEQSQTTLKADELLLQRLPVVVLHNSNYKYRTQKITSIFRPGVET